MHGHSSLSRAIGNASKNKTKDFQFHGNKCKDGIRYQMHFYNLRTEKFIRLDYQVFEALFKALYKKKNLPKVAVWKEKH